MAASSSKNTPQIDQTVAKTLLERELQQFAQARLEGNVDLAWHHLERAHIVSQMFVAQHIKSHLAMLGFAIDTGDIREVLGQLFRLLLTPLGAITRQVPLGNTGRSRVSAFTPIDIPVDLKAALQVAASEQYNGAKP
jgi:Protein of unknown function (DUF3703)